MYTLCGSLYNKKYSDLFLSIPKNWMEVVTKNMVLLISLIRVLLVRIASSFFCFWVCIFCTFFLNLSCYLSSLAESSTSPSSCLWISRSAASISLIFSVVARASAYSFFKSVVSSPLSLVISCIFSDFLETRSWKLSISDSPSMKTLRT